MPRLDPPIETRFPVNRKDHTQKGPYLTSFLKRCLKKKISFEDPETQKIIKGKVKDAIVWRLILNATQGDNIALKEIFERIDGKLAQKLIGEGMGGDTKIIIIRDGNKTENISGRISVRRSEIPSTNSGSGDGKDIIPSA